MSYKIGKSILYDVRFLWNVFWWVFFILFRNDHIVKRTKKYKERYENLLNKSHNLLRITRILTCLHIMTLEKYAVAFLDHLFYEVFSSSIYIFNNRIINRCRIFMYRILDENVYLIIIIIVYRNMLN